MIFLLTCPNDFLSNWTDITQTIVAIGSVLLIYFTFKEQQKMLTMEIKRFKKENVPYFILQPHQWAFDGISNSTTTVNLTAKRNDIYNLRIMPKYELKEAIKFDNLPARDGMIADTSVSFDFNFNVYTKTAKISEGKEDELKITLDLHYEDITGQGYIQKFIILSNNKVEMFMPKMIP